MLPDKPLNVLTDSPKTTSLGVLNLLAVLILIFFPEHSKHALELLGLSTGAGLLFARDGDR